MATLSTPTFPHRGVMPAHATTLSNHELPKDLTPMATLKGAKMSIPFIRFTEASATKPEAMVANPIPHVAMRKVSASKCDGYFRLWCSVTIQDSNAVARRVAPAPDHKTTSTCAVKTTQTKCNKSICE